MHPEIPVQFQFQNRTYLGLLVKVTGASSMALYHLFIKNYYQGQLFKTESGWLFSTQKYGSIPDLAAQFGQALAAAGSSGQDS